MGGTTREATIRSTTARAFQRVRLLVRRVRALITVRDLALRTPAAANGEDAVQDWVYVVGPVNELVPWRSRGIDMGGAA